MLHCVVTTIQPPTSSVEELAIAAKGEGACLVIVGDRKGPTEYCLSAYTGSSGLRLEFLSLQRQLDSGLRLARDLPTDHYARKNLGYLLAIEQGANCIYETDDDNAPLTPWAPRAQCVKAVSAEAQEWLNAYRHFSSENIWPRGFPLDQIKASGPLVSPADAQPQVVTAPIQQGLANGSPDVDAVWRMVLDQPVEFKDAPSLWLSPGSWCPFNSQSTWWWPEAYPLMYLPSHCSFRMTDIWRSFIAQRCLWELGYGVVFHAPEVFQERNPHNLMRDFAEEISGYLRNKELVEILIGLKLESGDGAQNQNLLACYGALTAAGFFPPEELDLVKTWLSDIMSLNGEKWLKA